MKKNVKPIKLNRETLRLLNLQKNTVAGQVPPPDSDAISYCIC